MPVLRNLFGCRFRLGVILLLLYILVEGILLLQPAAELAACLCEGMLLFKLDLSIFLSLFKLLPSEYSLLPDLGTLRFGVKLFESDLTGCPDLLSFGVL